jgi:type I restriction enzyme S subunit
MYTVKIKPHILEHRLDCSFYNPLGLSATQKLHSTVEVKKLSELIDQKRKITNGVRGPEWATSAYKLIRLQDCNHWIVNSDDAATISKNQFEENRRCKLKINDIVVAIGGYIGNAAVVVNQCEAVIGQHSAVLPEPEQAGADSRFLVAYLNSKFAEAIFSRYVSGTVQAGINLEDLRDLPAPRPSRDVQKYIGDKVRQAERLRAWEKSLQTKLDSFVQRYQPEQKTPSNLASMVSPDLLTDMLTATTYRDHYIKNQKNLRSRAKTTSIFHFLRSVTNGFDERDELAEGLPYVKVADVNAGYINLKNAPKIRVSALDDASPKQKPRQGDLLLTRKGTFGVAAVVMEATDFLCSSEVFSCKPKKTEFMPILAWFLNSSAGNMQFWQFSTGTTMPGINQGNLGSILVPDFSDVDLDGFNSLYEQRHKAKKNSELLTETAKLLVEALIEGQLTEAELIAAEQAQQAGNDQLDRRILNRLKTDGINGQGPALFSDLDELYRLLAQAEVD